MSKDGTKRGVKLAPRPTNSELLRQMDEEMKALKVALSLNQAMIRRLFENMQTLSQDLGKAYGIINDLQYKVLAMQEVGAFSVDALTAKSDELRLRDFTEASDAEDAEGNFTVGDVVENDSTVIITSTPVNKDATGIFRSRIKLATCGVPALVEGLIGKPVGTKVSCKLNDVEHEVELLGIRNPPPVAIEETTPEEAANIIPLKPNAMVH